MRQLWFYWRCCLCELLTSWALNVAPAGYVPGMVEAAMIAYRREGVFASGEKAGGK